MLRCFFALAALLLSYYLVKPLRDSQFLKEFDSRDLPLIYLVSSLFCLAVTRVFQWCSDRFSRRTVVAGTFGWALGCKLLFFASLREGGHLVTIAFYLWASVYFLLLLATLWGCFNERFGNEAGERCFPYIAMGAPLGTVAGAQLAGWTAGWGYSSLLWSGVSLVVALGCLWPEFAYPPRARSAAAHESSALGWLADPILRAIGMMVFALAVYTTVSNLITQHLLDHEIGQTVFQERLGGLHQQWRYEEFSGLREMDAARQQARLAELARTAHLAPEALRAAYTEYQNEREMHLRRLFAGISEGQGLLSILLLGVVCRPVIRRFGLRRAVLALPTFALCTLPLLLLPLPVLGIQVLLIGAGALNYSFNNVTKEMLYTVTSREAIVKAKPFIEGPLMRFGDVFCAILMFSARWVASILGHPEEWGYQFVLGMTALLVLNWWHLIRQGGSRYSSRSHGMIQGVENARDSHAHDLADHGELPDPLHRVAELGDGVKPDHPGNQQEAEQRIQGQ